MKKLIKELFDKNVLKSNYNIMQKSISYIKDSKKFFEELEKLLSDESYSKNDILNLYIRFKDKLGVKWV